MSSAPGALRAPRPVCGVISGDSRWSGEVLLEGDVVVPPGATLRIEAGSRLRFSARPRWAFPESRLLHGSRRPLHSSGGCGLFVLGRLLVEGREEAPVEFGSGESWGGIHLLDAGGTRLRHARLRGAAAEAVVLWDRSSARLEHVRIAGAWIGAAAYGRCRVLLAHCALAGLDAGLWVSGGSRVWVAASQLSCRRDLVAEAGARLSREGISARASAAPPQALRRAVLATGKIFPLRQAYRAAYALAVRIFSAWAGRWPAVLGVLSSRGWARGDWEPAVSDLDFIVVCEDGGGAEAAVWLPGFFESFRRVRGRLPMLGDVVVAQKREVLAYARWASSETHRRRAPLRGADPFPPDRGVSREAALMDAAEAYLRLCARLSCADPEPERVRAAHRFKFCADLLRGLAGAAGLDLGDPGLVARKDFWDALPELGLGEWRDSLSAALAAGGFPAAAACLRRFHGLAPSFDPLWRGVRAGRCPRAGTRRMPCGAAPEDEVRRRLCAELARRMGKSLGGVLFDDLYGSYVILEDVSAEDSSLPLLIESCLLAWGELGGGRKAPVVLTRRLWELWLRLPYQENPVRYLEMSDGAGDGPRQAGGPAGAFSQFHWGRLAPEERGSRLPLGAARFSAARLAFGWRRFAARSEATVPGMLHYMAGRLLGLRLIIERGVAAPFFDLETVLERARAELPGIGPELDVLREARAARTVPQVFLEHGEFFQSQVDALLADLA